MRLIIDQKNEKKGKVGLSPLGLATTEGEGRDGLVTGSSFVEAKKGSGITEDRTFLIWTARAFFLLTSYLGAIDSLAAPMGIKTESSFFLYW